MTAQALLPALANAPTTPSKGLWTLLTREDSVGACRAVALNQSLRAEAAGLLPRLQDRIAAPEADLAQFKALWMRHMLALGVPASTSPAEWGSLFDIYGRVLAGYSLEAIQAAFDKWHGRELYPDQPGRHGFSPKPAELLELAERHMTELRMAAYRAKKALEFVEDKGLEWTPERKKAERAKMIEMGLLTEDGKVNLAIRTKSMPLEKPQGGQHRMAEQLRSYAAQRRPDDVGDVI